MADAKQKAQAFAAWLPGFFKNWSADGKIRAIRLCLSNFLRRVTCNADDGRNSARPAEDYASITDGNVMGREVYAASSASKRNIYARVDQKTGPRAFRNGAYCAPGKSFQVPSAEVFFAQLNVVDTGGGTLRDLFQQARFLVRAVTRKLRAVGDVAEQQWHRDRDYGKVCAISGPSSVICRATRGSRWNLMRPSCKA